MRIADPERRTGERGEATASMAFSASWLVGQPSVCDIQRFATPVTACGPQADNLIHHHGRTWRVVAVLNSFHDASCASCRKACVSLLLEDYSSRRSSSDGRVQRFCFNQKEQVCAKKTASMDVFLSHFSITMAAILSPSTRKMISRIFMRNTCPLSGSMSSFSSRSSPTP